MCPRGCSVALRRYPFICGHIDIYNTRLYYFLFISLPLLLGESNMVMLKCGEWHVLSFSGFSLARRCVWYVVQTSCCPRPGYAFRCLPSLFDAPLYALALCDVIKSECRRLKNRIIGFCHTIWSTVWNRSRGHNNPVLHFFSRSPFVSAVDGIEFKKPLFVTQRLLENSDDDDNIAMKKKRTHKKVFVNLEQALYLDFYFFTFSVLQADAERGQHISVDIGSVFYYLHYIFSIWRQYRSRYFRLIKTSKRK